MLIKIANKRIFGFNIVNLLGGLAPSGSVNLSSTGLSHPNEPVGAVRLAEVDWTAQSVLPSNGAYASYGDAGFWFSNRGNMSLDSSLGLIQRFPAGLGEGQTPGTVHVRPTASSSGTPNYSQIYIQIKGIRWGRTIAEGGDGQFEMNGEGEKLLFARVGDTGTGSCIPKSRGPGAPSSVVSSFGIRHEFTSAGNPPDQTKVGPQGIMQTGVEYDFEFLYTVNDVDVSNGIMNFFLNGTIVNGATVSNGLWRTSSKPLGFHELWFDMTWGGGGGGNARTRLDYLFRRYMYWSGIP